MKHSASLHRAYTAKARSSPQNVASVQQHFALRGLVETDTGSLISNWVVCRVRVVEVVELCGLFVKRTRS